MLYVLNIINSIAESNTVFYLLVIILIGISLAMFYLIYSQNKEMKMELMKRNQEKSTKVELDMPKEEDAKIPDLVEVTREDIPDKLLYTQALWQNDSFDLQNITHELETMPKERKINMTPYEAEQEEKAIISYDELVSQSSNGGISYSDTTSYPDNVVVKQVDLEKTGKLDLGSVEKEASSKIDIMKYEHEEAFLEALKQLQNILN